MCAAFAATGLLRRADHTCSYGMERDAQWSREIWAATVDTVELQGVA
jgi:hypothetical protein